MITKIYENFNFKFIKNYNINDISEYVKNFSNEWYYNTSRQDTYKVHEFTTSFFLYEHSNTWSDGDSYKIELMCNDDELLNLVSPVINELENIYSGRVGKALFINLGAGKEVLEHSDTGDYLGMARRFHIPIITNPDVIFMINGEKKYLETGDCWEINNSKPHYVFNGGSEDRIHLLIDILPNSFFEGKNERN